MLACNDQGLQPERRAAGDAIRRTGAEPWGVEEFVETTNYLRLIAPSRGVEAQAGTHQLSPVSVLVSFALVHERSAPFTDTP